MSTMKPVRIIAIVGSACAFGLTTSAAKAGVYPNDPNRYWPGNTIPYVFQPGVTANQQGCILAAMTAWMGLTNVNFVVRTNQADYLSIQPTGSQPSYPPPEGYRSGTGIHVLNMGTWGDFPNSAGSCTAVFGICHELGHALGLLHTHQSPQRNNYFNYFPERVQTGFTGNYNIDLNSLEWPAQTADIDSIMSYPLCVFSNCANCGNDIQNCAPLTLKEPFATQWAGALSCPTQCPPPVTCVGQRNHLSLFDGLVITYLYPLSNWRFANVLYNGVTESGTFLRPAKTFINGRNLIPANGGTLYMEPGTYSGSVGVHNNKMTIKATRPGSAVIK